ncbi:hypothetical protein SCP_1005660 [Sparassis crispa]|uniref:Uncharacterized protein n=1 Tax=Sparassis crispa TaxID=139825 RepID=A0A401GYS5_9APHY|nr:hypothetical protein SCP_1005660 [Sparassis crispa]GBE87318.1 hypothetical protein SCP_1005660 [Sparassis crispa]
MVASGSCTLTTYNRLYAFKNKFCLRDNRDTCDGGYQLGVGVDWSERASWAMWSGLTGCTRVTPNRYSIWNEID